MKKDLYINGFASVSALGISASEVWEAYQNPRAYFKRRKHVEKEYWVSPVSAKVKVEAELLKSEKKTYQYLDESVLFAILASRKLKKNLAKSSDFPLNNTGVNLGSSRGATQLFEQHHQEFLETGSVASRTSPTTTLGNLSSWVAQDLGTSGAVISHSITCSTALHGILNAAAWLQSGMATSFIVGGTEAPLTPFTLAQLEALKLYSNLNEKFPCHSLNFNKQSNTLVLGEAASVFALSTQSENAVARISGLGFANEQIKHSIAISSDAKCFQDSMKMALTDARLKQVDAIIMHAPGTIKGDEAELNAIQNVFEKTPFLTTNKWKIGHTYAASGAMSLELALLMLQHQECIPNPFYKNAEIPQEINHIMVNAVGFGGNAVSLIISKL
ncbi:beta-ketoacyl synthase N-terminal-like domain-containing protein [Psychroflexus planctonicus]|uniref:beta-ketoacyl synthase N-terminal-like domain-containing protein n=1 Tax=Psychroflexus planctonicus TaxID=1526575 RepID=UPI001665AFB3|nr:beta-ketoacyl synthase N-terminal-like domain-containing protein [Psychroflexus planctonicus]